MDSTKLSWQGNAPSGFVILNANDTFLATIRCTAGTGMTTLGLAREARFYTAAFVTTGDFFGSGDAPVVVVNPDGSLQTAINGGGVAADAPPPPVRITCLQICL